MWSTKDVVLLFLGPPVSFLLGYLWQRVARAVVHRRARRFWRPMVSGDLLLVLGQHRTLGGFERSGLVGVGGMRALTELVRHLDDIGVQDYQVEHNDKVGWRDGESSPLRKNLVLIGGPDANEVTAAVLASLTPGIRFTYLSRDRRELPDQASGGAARAGERPAGEWSVPAFVDLATDCVYAPSVPGVDSLAFDRGVVIRAPNPFNPSAHVVILAGAYGHGTLAAARLVLSGDFLRQLPRDLDYFEVLFTVDVVHDDPQEPREEVRRTTPARGRER